MIGACFETENERAAEARLNPNTRTAANTHKTFFISYLQERFHQCQQNRCAIGRIMWYTLCDQLQAFSFI